MIVHNVNAHVTRSGDTRTTRHVSNPNHNLCGMLADVNMGHENKNDLQATIWTVHGEK